MWRAFLFFIAAALTRSARWRGVSPRRKRAALGSKRFHAWILGICSSRRKGSRWFCLPLISKDVVRETWQTARSGGATHLSPLLRETAELIHGGACTLSSAQGPLDAPAAFLEQQTPFFSLGASKQLSLSICMRGCDGCPYVFFSTLFERSATKKQQNVLVLERVSLRTKEPHLESTALLVFLSCLVFGMVPP